MAFIEHQTPKEVKATAKVLEGAGFKAYLVGGCVRDLLLGRAPKDWDIATNATPDQIQKLLPDSVYENEFGTVGVKLEKSPLALPLRAEGGRGGDVRIVEVTTYRKEGKYSDKRHPDGVVFAKTIEEDLSRRDFTMNAIAIALNPKSDLVDPFDGQADIKNKVIRTVGDPKERFNEDALRLLRAVRFAVELDFGIEKKTADAIRARAGLLEFIAKERIRDEFVKIIMTNRAADGVRMLAESGLLRYIIPDLLEGVGVGQNKHHIYNVFEHNVRALDYAADKNYSLEVRLASLLHDVGKPRTKQGDGPESTFYAHEIVGGKMTFRILDRLRFSREVTEWVAHLVRHHLFYYNVGEVSEAGVRRFLRKVGPENIADLIKVREADRIGSGVPKAVPYKLRHLLFMIEKVKQDPIDTRMLKINGDRLMSLLDIPQGMRVGFILSALLEEALDDPARNTVEYLERRAQELHQLSDVELKKVATAARGKKEEFESGREEGIKRQFHVK